VAKINIGKMACETCGNQVTVKQNENATLSYRCDECDAAPYAKTGTLQNLKWRERLTALTKAESSHELQVEVAQPAPVAEKPKETVKTDMWGHPL
jgi:DNA-directed RNA polymerase subunit M/transcription elongation factor TFIIS